MSLGWWRWAVGHEHTYGGIVHVSEVAVLGSAWWLTAATPRRAGCSTLLGDARGGGRWWCLVWRVSGIDDGAQLRSAPRGAPKSERCQRNKSRKTNNNNVVDRVYVIFTAVISSKSDLWCTPKFKTYVAGWVSIVSWIPYVINYPARNNEQIGWGSTCNLYESYLDWFGRAWAKGFVFLRCTKTIWNQWKLFFLKDFESEFFRFETEFHWTTNQRSTRNLA